MWATIYSECGDFSTLRKCKAAECLENAAGTPIELLSSKKIMKLLYVLILFLLSTTLHAQMKLNQECIPVSAFYAIETSFISTDVIWSGGTPAMEYVVSYRRLDDTIWYAVSVFEDSIASIYALDTCTGYEFNITSVCDELTEVTSESDTFYTLCDTVGSSIQNLTGYKELVVYPNPANGIINIRFNRCVYGDVIILIRNSSGILIEKKKYFLNGEETISNLQLSNEISGTNYITLIFNDNIFTQTLLTTKL